MGYLAFLLATFGMTFGIVLALVLIFFLADKLREK